MWTLERKELVALWWGEGLSATQIAARLGDGISRNAVIGLIRRLREQGSALRAKPQREHNPRATRRIRTSKPPRRASPPLRPEVLPPVVVTVAPIIGTVQFIDRRRDQCAWPAWDDCRGRDVTTLMVCGAAVPNDDAQPYCTAHRDLSRSRGHLRTDLEKLARAVR